MKRCPQCNRQYADESLYFCLEDGTSLLSAEEVAAADTIEMGLGSFPTLEMARNEQSAADPSLEKAAEVARKLEYKQKLSSLLNSEDGLRLASVEMGSLFTYVKNKVDLINEKYPSLQIQFGQNDRNEGTVSNARYVVIMAWHPHYANTLSESSLQIVEKKRSWPYPTESDELSRVAFDFYMTSDFQLGWKERNGHRFLTTSKLGDECIDRLLHLIPTTEE